MYHLNIGPRDERFCDEWRPIEVSAPEEVLQKMDGVTTSNGIYIRTDPAAVAHFIENTSLSDDFFFGNENGLQWYIGTLEQQRARPLVIPGEECTKLAATFLELVGGPEAKPLYT